MSYLIVKLQFQLELDIFRYCAVVLPLRGRAGPNLGEKQGGGRFPSSDSLDGGAYCKLY